MGATLVSGDMGEGVQRGRGSGSRNRLPSCFPRSCCLAFL